MRNLRCENIEKVAYLVLKVAMFEVMERERERNGDFCIHVSVMETLEVSPFSERFMKIPGRGGR